MFLQKLFQLSDEDLERLFCLAYRLHPCTAVAVCLLADGIQRAALVHRTQSKNPRGEMFYTLETPEQCLFQLGVYLASESWERDQESAQPTKDPSYQPTHWDGLTRYVKLLIMETMLRRSCYGAVGVGCCLYTASLSTITRLFEQFYSPHNMRHYKATLLERIHDRFNNANAVIVRGKRHTLQVSTRSPEPHEIAFVYEAMQALKPCFPEIPPHRAVNPNPSSLLDYYFGYEASRAELREWWRIYALLDPVYAGLPRLVQDYNVRRTPMPRSLLQLQLGIPTFLSATPPMAPEDPGERGARFSPQPLTTVERRDLRRTLSAALQRQQQRLLAYMGGELTVSINGAIATPVRVGQDAFESFTVPHSASYLELYGHDAAGAFLLALVPLPTVDLHDAQDEWCCEVHLEQSWTLALTLRPLPAASAALWEVGLQFNTPVAQPHSLPDTGYIPLRERLVRWLSPLWHPPLAGELVTAADTAAQEQVFPLDEGSIRLTCQWWAATQGQPAALWVAWYADITLPGTFWVRFTRRDDPTAVLAERPLGGALTGEAGWSADELGFDPTREPWALTLVLTEPHA